MVKHQILGEQYTYHDSDEHW